MDLQALLTTNIFLLGQEVSIVAIMVAVVVILGMALFTAGSSPEPTALDPEQWIPFKLKEVESLSHDVKKFRFALQSDKHRLGLPIGQHISLKYVDHDGKDVIRSYTPTSSDDDIGVVDFAIKVYMKNVHPKFPEG